jgi:Domain of unknown function (DUF5667)
MHSERSRPTRPEHLPALESLRETPALDDAARLEARRVFLAQAARLRQMSRRRAWRLPLAAFAALSLSGIGAVAAAQSSTPNDTLYPVKLLAEDVQLALTVQTDARRELLLSFAERRADELDETQNLTPSVIEEVQARRQAQLAAAARYVESEPRDSRPPASATERVSQPRLRSLSPVASATAEERVVQPTETAIPTAEPAPAAQAPDPLPMQTQTLVPPTSAPTASPSRTPLPLAVTATAAGKAPIPTVITATPIYTITETPAATPTVTATITATPTAAPTQQPTRTPNIRATWEAEVLATTTARPTAVVVPTLIRVTVIASQTPVLPTPERTAVATPPGPTATSEQPTDIPPVEPTLPPTVAP